uniref:Outer capsid protein VP5 n=1 Tax=Mudumu virus TaxID=2841875 RepID=A0A8E8R9H2_9REOV|nr:outer capsid protein 2 [Mudumu virus]
MVKFSGTLNRIGGRLSQAFKSNTAKKILSAVGAGAKKALESETGQAALAGLVQGTAETVLIGGNYGENIKKAVVTNVLGVHDIVTDPMDPMKHVMVEEIERMKQDKSAKQLFERYATVTKDKLSEVNSEIGKIESYLKLNQTVGNQEQSEIEVLESAVKVFDNALTKEHFNINSLRDALKKEAHLRTAEEKKLIDCMKRNYDSMSNIMKKEKEALIEEAVQQTIDISGEVAEHLCSDVPLVGDAIASGVVTARAATQMYKLHNIISDLSGLDIHHIKMPSITPKALEIALTKDNINEHELGVITQSRIEHIEENINELRHVEENVLKDLRVKAITHGIQNGAKGTSVLPNLKTDMAVASKHHPKIHFYTTKWDSEYVIMFHVVGPYHTGSSFLLCFDLMSDVVGFYDVIMPIHHVNRNIKPPIGAMSLKSAFDEFLKMASQNVDVSEMHKRRLKRGIGQQPLHIGSQHYQQSYVSLRRNAQKISQDAEIQSHILIGPLNMQRTTLLNVLLHGIVLINNSGRNTWPERPE